jgi:hypothetical protein
VTLWEVSGRVWCAPAARLPELPGAASVDAENPCDLRPAEPAVPKLEDRLRPDGGELGGKLDQAPGLPATHRRVRDLLDGCDDLAKGGVVGLLGIHGSAHLRRDNTICAETFRFCSPQPLPLPRAEGDRDSDAKR